MRKQPLLILSICFILGIFFQDEVMLWSFSNILWILVLCGILIGLVYVNHFYFFKIKPIILGLLFFGLGILFHSSTHYSNENYPEFKKEDIIFKINKKLNSTEKNKKYEIEASIEDFRLNAILYIPREAADLDYQHIYKTHAYVNKVKSPQYDFQFDYARYLQRKNIHYQIFAQEKISKGKISALSFWDKIKQKRLEVLKNINQSSLTFKSREFLKGIILADRTGMDAETTYDFNRSGLVHFLAISGTHVVIIFGMIYFLLMKYSPLKFRKYAIVISLLFIWTFALFIGFGNSVVRSCIMLSVYYIYVLLQRKPDLLHALALSALIILVIDTQQLFDVGFQLSFIAVLGIYWFNQPILNYFPLQDTYFKKIIFNTISISISAQLATLPIVLYYFHQFSLVSIFANFFIVPFSELIIIFSFLMTILFLFGINFHAINLLYDVVVNALLKIIHWFATWESLFIDQIPFSLSEVFSVFLILYFLRFLIQKTNFLNWYKFIFSVILFVFLRVTLSYYWDGKEEFLLHNDNKSKSISIKKGKLVLFYVSEGADLEKFNKFVIIPYCVSRRANNATIRTYPFGTKSLSINGEIYPLK